MKSKIFYFTGTGNSLYIAKKAASVLNDCKLDSIAKYYESEKVVIDDETLGFVFPLYFSGIPKIVCDFIVKADLSKVNYIFAVVNCGFSFTSAALSVINKLLKSKGKKLNAGFCFNMVDNYLINFEMPSTPEKQKKFEDSFEKILLQIKNIVNNKIDKKQFEFSFLKNLISEPWLKKVNKLDNNFYYYDSCNSCKTCAKVCPVYNIKMINGKPSWNNKCQLCLACIHFCPQKAIQFKNKTENKKYRYFNRNVGIKEIIEQKA